MNWKNFGRLHRPYFGQITLWVILICAQPLSWYFQIAWHTFTLGNRAGQTHALTERNGLATVLSFLPEAFLLSPIPMQIAGALVAIGSILWLSGRWIPFSGWLTSLSFTTQVALYMENSTQTTHVAHMTNVMLLLHAIWYHCFAREIRQAIAENRFWSTPLYPEWVHSLGVFYIGLFYGMSGLVKLATSGLNWANGLSLQLWVELWGNPHSWGTALILQHRWIAAVLQWLTLIGETGGLVAIFSPAARIVIGILLIGFHFGAIAVFGWGFHSNVALLFLFFFPCNHWINSLGTYFEKRFNGSEVLQPDPPIKF